MVGILASQVLASQTERASPISVHFAPPDALHPQHVHLATPNAHSLSFKLTRRAF